jgi:hypothetical protein
MTKIHTENYSRPDPFKYRDTPDDWLRLALVRDILLAHERIPALPYRTALDIGAGEGFITDSLPAVDKWGFDVSADAMERFPPTVSRFDPVLNSAKKFDLICAMGVLYPFYETSRIRYWMAKHRHELTHFLIAGVPDWEQGIEVITDDLGVRLVKTVDIRPYRAYPCQRIRLYKP